MRGVVDLAAQHHTTPHHTTPHRIALQYTVADGFVESGFI
jgi:hypothetical protein